MNNTATALTGAMGEQVVLTDVTVNASLQDLLGKVNVSQTYRNEERNNIEAVYTFPLPLDAVLLELEVKIASRVLKGVVIERGDAEQQYEKAVEEGDQAVMLEMSEPGLYTMNVGNLLPGEEVVITFEYAVLYRWSGDSFRFFLPTTIAPRYGVSPLRPHQELEHSLTVENQFSLSIDIRGSLAAAQFSCPSHDVCLSQSGGRVLITMADERAVMDRDFVLMVKAPPGERGFAICGPDGDGAAAVASFQPFFPGLHRPQPLDLVVVIDCSGSMNGDSMAQARKALDGILERLSERDSVSLIAFGTDTRLFSQRLVPCNKKNMMKLKRFVNQLNADMGGTAIEKALGEAYRILGNHQGGDIFLVTDGEVGHWQSVVNDAGQTRNRIFTVGVGSAVSEAFVRELSDQTGGSSEFVSPREGMSDRVIRHFERMRAPRARRVEVHWPEGASLLCPSIQGSVFEGDTIVSSACYPRAITDEKVDLVVETEAGEIITQSLVISRSGWQEAPGEQGTVARMAAAMRLNETDDLETGRETAVKYRLTSQWTNWLVVDERAKEDKAETPPELRKVPQTLAAGWGGIGSVKIKMSVANMPLPRQSRVECAFEPSLDLLSRESVVGIRHSRIPKKYEALVEIINIDPAVLRPQDAFRVLDESGLRRECREIHDLASRLDMDPDLVAACLLVKLFNGRLSVGLTDEVIYHLDSLRELVDEFVNEIKRILVFCKEFMEQTEHALESGAVRSGALVRTASEQRRIVNSLEKILDLAGA